MTLKRVHLLATLVALFALATSAEAGRILATPEQLLAAKRVDFIGANAFAIEPSASGSMLRSTPRKSASGLYKKLSIDGRELSNVTWTWRVDKLHRSADLRQLAREDAGATVFFVFGEPTMFNRDVPTLAYVWSSTAVPAGTVMTAERYPSVHYVQLRGPEAVGTAQTEMRNVADDFRKVFKREPDALNFVAVFNDNDQTGEACSALFGAIKAE